MRWAALSVAGCAILGSAQPVELLYRIDAVSRKSEVIRATEVTLADVGRELVAGDEVRTGWRGRVTLSVPTRATRFEISPSTHVRLAGPEPGVLLLLHRGSLRAVFDALAGREDRLVSTPGALLAVRGTRYAVEVAPTGEASLAVFSGAVDVMPLHRSLPSITVVQGELCHFGPLRAPTRRPLPSTLNERTWEGHRG